MLPNDPVPGEKRNGVDPGEWTPDHLGLPPDCPVIPLGVDGPINWCLDTIGQLVAYTKPYGQADTLELFRGRHDYLKWAWPRHDKGGRVDSWRNELVRETIIAACTAKGPWSPVERLRGRGAWLDEGGSIVYHLGHKLWIGGRAHPPGEIGGHVYQTRPRLPGPWPQPVPETENPARLLRPMLQSWAWARPDVDPMLLTGWIACAMVGGALPWRPACYITGDKGTGKSTLQDLVKRLLGDALIQAVDTSAAGLYQHMGHDCLAVAVDELEGESDTRKTKAVLKLARIAASGGLMLRGGDRHQGVEFRARSCFLFSSINTPPLEPQDLSRMALLRLHQLPRGAREPDLNPGTMAMMGQAILRRMIDQWHRFGETWQAFRAELREAGMDSRGQDTFGVLLAAADLLEHDGWDEARLRVPAAGDLMPIRQLMAVGNMGEFEDATANWLGCLSHLLSVHVEAWRSGARKTVGQVIEGYFNGDDDISTSGLARGLLSQAGLSLVSVGPKDDRLVIPNQNPLTRQLFEGSKWAGEAGAGVWSGALRQAPPDLQEPGQARINGVKSRATLIRLAGLYGPDGIMRTTHDPTAGFPDPIQGT